MATRAVTAKLSLMPTQDLTVIETSREHLGWVLHETEPRDADHRVLLLPGALATWAFYDDLLAVPSIRESGISFIATTVPDSAVPQLPLT